MTRRNSARRLRSGFNLGGEQAETDPLLGSAFYESGHYTAMASRVDPRCFLIGRTGSGKSAALKRLEDSNPGHVIRVSPEDLSLTYIVDLPVVQYLSRLDIHLDPLFIALWKHVFLVEIIKHRYDVESPVAKQNFLGVMRDKIKQDKSKRAALDYLEQFEDRFWCETDERVRDITQNFESQIRAVAEGNLGVSGLGSLQGKKGGTTTVGTQERIEETNRFQRVVNDTQLARLNKMIKVLDEDILESSQNFTYVVIDDLDRDWVDEQVANDLIRCLFRTVMDLKPVSNLKILVALRTNIFEQLNFGARTGGQEEKFRSLELPMRWTAPEIESILNERARVAAEHFDTGTIHSIKDLLPQTNRQRGNAFQYIIEHTLMRPRDAIAFVNECLKLATGKIRLSWRDINFAEAAYSHNRLLALRDEWKPSYPGIDKVLNLFHGVPIPMSKDEFTRVLDDAVLLSAERDFAGTQWMDELSAPILKEIGRQSWAEQYQPLVRFLYDIGFIGCTKVPTGSIKYVHHVPGFADSVNNLETVEYFLVHPAFHSALDVVKRETHYLK